MKTQLGQDALLLGSVLNHCPVRGSGALLLQVQVFLDGILKSTCCDCSCWLKVLGEYKGLAVGSCSNASVNNYLLPP